jgi:mono/diheme cytochrome c family protein
VRRPAPAILLALLASGALTAGCGSGGEPVDDEGARLFNERCSGCHTLSSAGARGSASKERISGPNLDQRSETKDGVLFAIRNGGFSGAIMPQNIVVGEEAEAVAEFVAREAGTKAESPPSPSGSGSGSGPTGDGQ